MPNIPLSEVRKKEFYVIRDSDKKDVLNVIFPNGLQTGLVGLNQQPETKVYGNFIVSGSAAVTGTLAVQGKIGIGVSNPTALLHFTTGSTSAGFAPVKFTSGTLLPVTEPGAIEYDGTDLYYTIHTDSQVRRNITAKPYASFLNTSTTTATTATVVSLAFNETAYSSYVTLVSSTKVYPGYSGMYNIQYSMQLQNTDGNEQEAYVWIRKNGNDVANTKSIITIPKQRGVGSPGFSILAINVFEYVAVGSYIELVWYASSTLVSAVTIPSTISPASPASPAVILTINRID